MDSLWQLPNFDYDWVAEGLRNPPQNSWPDSLWSGDDPVLWLPSDEAHLSPSTSARLLRPDEIREEFLGLLPQRYLVMQRPEAPTEE